MPARKTRPRKCLKDGRIKLSSGWFCSAVSAEKQFGFLDAVLTPWRKKCPALCRKIIAKNIEVWTGHRSMKTWLYSEADLKKVREIWDHTENGGNGWPTLPEAAEKIGLGKRAIEHWLNRGCCPYLPKRRRPLVKLDFRLTPIGIKKVLTFDPDDLLLIETTRRAEADGLVSQAFVRREYGFTQGRLNAWATNGCPALDGEPLHREMIFAPTLNGRPLDQWHYRLTDIEKIKAFRKGGKARRAGRLSAKDAEKRFGVSDETVRRLAAEHNLSTEEVFPPNGPKTQTWLTADLRPIVADYKRERDENRRERGRRLASKRHGASVDGQSKTDAPSEFIPSELQREILELLDGKAMKTDDLETALKVARKTMYGYQGKGGLTELMEQGLVKNSRRMGGYYRPHA